MLRERILLVRGDGMFEAYTPSKQSDPTCFLVIVSPACWRRMDAHLLLVSVRDQDRSPFLVVLV